LKLAFVRAGIFGDGVIKARDVSAGDVNCIMLQLLLDQKKALGTFVLAPNTACIQYVSQLTF
jgi:hypothetical protein